jgi:hypothetical protein
MRCCSLRPTNKEENDYDKYQSIIACGRPGKRGCRLLGSSDTGIGGGTGATIRPYLPAMRDNSYYRSNRWVEWTANVYLHGSRTMQP